MTYDPTDSDADGVVEADVNNSSVQTDQLPPIADHIVETKSELEAVLPTSSGGSSNLSTGDTIYIDGPITIDTTVFANVEGTTIYGTFSYGGQTDIQVASGAGDTCIEPYADNVTIEGISFDGNGEFTRMFAEDDFTSNNGPVWIGYCHYTNTVTQSHADSGVVQLTNKPDGVYLYHNEIDHPLDQSYNMQDCRVQMRNCWSYDGFDRYLLLSGCEGVLVMGGGSIDNVEGSVIGQSGGGVGELKVIGFTALGANKSLSTWQSGSTASGGNEHIVFVGNTLVRESAPDTGGTEAGINIEDTVNAVVLANTIEAYGDGIEVNGAEDFVADYNHFKDIGNGAGSAGSGHVLNIAGATTEPNFGRNNTWDNIAGSVVNGVSNATQPRWGGVIGGGPFGGVDLGSVNGQYDGDRAIADGTNANTSLGDLGYWDDGNTQWLVFNQDATV